MSAEQIAVDLARGLIDALYNDPPNRPATDEGQLGAIADMLDRVDAARDRVLWAVTPRAPRTMQADLRRIAASLTQARNEGYRAGRLAVWEEVDDWLTNNILVARREVEHDRRTGIEQYQAEGR